MTDQTRPYVDYSGHGLLVSESYNMQETPKHNRNPSATVNESLLPPPEASIAESSQSEQKIDSDVFMKSVGGPIKAPGLLFSIIRNWWLELGCLVLSMIALVATAITLSTHQGRPLPEWPYSISVNSLISVYIIVLKAAMLVVITEGLSQLKWAWYEKSRPLGDLHHFDRASRGPLGALQLIWTLRGRHLVATAGAIIVIVALIIDPMAQALVRYYSCSIELPSISADIPIKNIFSEMGPHIGAGLGSLPYTFQSAINAGLFNPESVKIPFACPTGNCTFDSTYHTLAYCSKCTDLSKDLTITCQNQTLSSQGFGDSNDTEPQCITALPNGLNSSAFLEDVDYLNAFGTNSNYTFIAANLTKVYETTVGNCTTEADNATASWSCSGSGAAVCELNPCIRSYKATVHNNVLQENLIETSQNWNDTAMEVEMTRKTLNVACLSEQVRQNLKTNGYLLNSTFIPYSGDGFLANGTEFNATATPHPNVTVPQECVFQFYEPTVMSVQYFLATFFNGSVQETKESTYYYDTKGSVQLNKLYNSGNMSFEYVDGKFKDVADSMTAYIRQSQKPQNDAGFSVLQDKETAPARGRVFGTDTCIDARWRFFALPIALVALSALFLFAMIAETIRKDRSHAWKSSSLALLFSGLDAAARQSRGALEQLDDMTSAAKNMKVRLRKTKAGWHFVENR